mmetsp:Transcript_13723/g.39022  ORF Transcript_13723/g.39022 Transcript_13723/m.39022 type:complete len:140 (+) Transcript_13723:1085-1504(+)
MVDSPGVMLPRVDDAEVGLKLMLLDCIKESRVEMETTVDFLLFILNRREDHRYVAALNLLEPTSNIHVLLRHVAAQRFDGSTRARTQAAAYFLDLYRKGLVGRFGLDDFEYPLVENVPSSVADTLDDSTRRDDSTDSPE